MQRRFPALILVFLLVASLLCSCASKTPDELEKENVVTLDSLDWSFDVEGAQISKYTLADAEKHELSKLITSAVLTGEGDVNKALRSFRVDGITLEEFLADAGVPDAKTVTVYGHDEYGEDINFTFTISDVGAADIRIGWISNIENVLPDSISYVGIFFPTSVVELTSCTSITKLVIA